MSARAQAETRRSASADGSWLSARPGLHQRKCARGGTPGPSGKCETCRQRKLQRRLGNLPAPSNYERCLPVKR
jgi:hypothetical protein